VPFSSVYKQPALLLPYSLKQEDPFGDLPDPPKQRDCLAKVTDSTPIGSITPGSCYRGFDVDKALTLLPGTYYIVGAPLSGSTANFHLNAKADIIAEGVTFVFTQETFVDSTTGVESAGPYPTIAINGSAKLKLTAPESGQYEGIIMHYDGRAPAGAHTINGNAGAILEGAFYFPTQNLTFNGNFGMEANCIQLVAFRLTFEGHTEINNQCDADGSGAQAFDAEWVRLVK